MLSGLDYLMKTGRSGWLFCGTYNLETILPKLPVPPLEDTMRKYLNTLRPLLNEHEHEQVKKIVDTFAGDGGLGRKLQLYLLKRRENMDNWKAPHAEDNPL
ncbi:hypothetical protein D910_03230 [Dendroctonus ponderosae]|uniref:Choline/carnitine acyltransferase domain-containing protein n=1 Tax=Dendroctonus ponderosae TaxID=77166 RepID=U4U786_DENPD|nr:hypothetical protein D910_03230 [Dendroctonus ponderosae]